MLAIPTPFRAGALSDNWVPVIEKDVDGTNSLPLRLDGEVPNLGKFAACRRVARAIYLGSAPIATAAHRGQRHPERDKGRLPGRAIVESDKDR